MAGVFDAFPAFSRIEVRKLPCTLRALKAWWRLTPSRRRKALLLGCWQATFWRLVERGQVQMALYVFLGLSACSRPSTLLATRRCDLVKPAKGSSRFWVLQQHPQEKARPSKTQRYDESCLLDLATAELDDLFLAKSSAHDHRPIWKFTCSAASCCGKWTGNSDSLPTSSLRRQRGHISPISNVGCCSEKRSLVAGKKSIHRYEHSSRIAAGTEKWSRKSEHNARRMQKKHHIQIVLGSRHPVHRTRQELMLLREAGSA